MNVEEFVSESLMQIIQGIKKAQAGSDGANINARFVGGETGGNIIHAQEYGVFTRVDFDIAVTAETAGKAGAGVKIWVVGAEGAAEHKAGTASRISFSVPVRLPDGDSTRADLHEEEERRKYARLSADDGGSAWTA